MEIDPIKGSRFVASAAAVSSEAEARAFLAEIAAEMPDATHHCAAWRIASPVIDRAVDAGEPSGSAGRPILAQLTGREIVDACVVVTRWFGGTKLGVGGLVRAYGAAAAAVLDAAALVPRVATETLTLRYGYADGKAVDRVLAEWGVGTIETAFGEGVVRTIVVGVDVREGLALELRDRTAGRVRLLGA